MSEKTEKPETTPDSAPFLPQLIGRFGLYATYVVAALILLLVAGDLHVLVQRAPLVGWLALLIGMGPLIALLLSTFASYVNYYGVWRVLRGKDEYNAGQDLKSHAADIPQAVQAMFAARAGCLPAASTVLLFVSLLLAGATTVPPGTPLIGNLGAWSAHVDSLASNTGPAAPTVAALATDTPVVFVTPTPTATATPRPTAVPTATPVPVVIRFSISPTTASYSGCLNAGPPPPQAVTLNNSGSNVAVHWQASVVEKDGSGLPWASLSSASGVVPAHSKQTITVTPQASVCRQPGLTWHVRIVANGAGTYTFGYKIS